MGIVGASGYSGAELARLLAAHPAFDLAFCTSDRHAGQPVGEQLGMRGFGDMRFVANAAARDVAETCDVVMLATSAEVSAELAPAILERKKHVIDLSGAFRLESAADYTKWYGFEHPEAKLLASAHYGLPEVFGAGDDSPGTLIANPGCYPTAALLALAPLLRAGLVDGEGIIVDAKSGVTGAGRQATEAFSFVEIDEDLRAYKLLTHQHTPEIERALRRLSERASVTFTAHLLPIRRGLLATCYARPRGATPRAIEECLASAYRESPFVDVCAPDQVRIQRVVGTNHALVGATANADVVIVVCAIDNLLKGAAGQAVQNLNLLHGIDESSGLTHLHRMAS